MLLKTQIFQNKCRLSKEEKILAHFSRIIEHDKYRQAFYKSPEGSLTYNMQMIRSFLWDMGVERNKRPRKKHFSKWKTFWPIFPSVIEGDKPQGTFSKGPLAVLSLAVKFITAFFRTYEDVENTNFWEKRQPFKWKKMFDQFFPYYRAYKHSRNTLWRSKRYSDIYCGTYKSIFSDLRGCWKHNFWRKRQPFQWKKIFDQF